MCDILSMTDHPAKVQIKPETFFDEDATLRELESAMSIQFDLVSTAHLESRAPTRNLDR